MMLPSRQPHQALWMCVALLATCSGFAARAQAEVFRLLPEHQQALQVRVDVIQQAQYQIDCAVYAADTGRVPAALLLLLLEAAERGVRVRLLVDGLMSRLPAGLHQMLRMHGVEVHVYRPPDGFCPRSLNQRLHDKLLIVDGVRLVMGSRNLQDAHFGLGRPCFVDCDAYIEGPTAQWAGAYFHWLWNQEHVRPLASVNLLGRTVAQVLPAMPNEWSPQWQSARSEADYRALLEASLKSLVDAGVIRLHTGVWWGQGCDPAVALEFVHETDADKRRRSVQNRFLQLIREAQHSLLIQTPYPVFTERDIQTILDARRRGIRVVLCTNSLYSTDCLLTYSALENSKDLLLIAGVEIYESPGPNHLHNKAVIIDDLITVIGSYNFDERSANLNMEVSVIAYDHATAIRLRHIIEAQMHDAHRVSTSPPLLVDAVHQGSAARYWKMHFGRLLVPTFRWLL